MVQQQEVFDNSCQNNHFTASITVWVVQASWRGGSYPFLLVSQVFFFLCSLKLKACLYLFIFFHLKKIFFYIYFYSLEAGFSGLERSPLGSNQARWGPPAPAGHHPQGQPTRPQELWALSMHLSLLFTERLASHPLTPSHFLLSPKLRGRVKWDNLSKSTLYSIKCNKV